MPGSEAALPTSANPYAQPGRASGVPVTYSSNRLSWSVPEPTSNPTRVATSFQSLNGSAQVAVVLIQLC